MLCTPAASVLVMHCAVRVLPDPAANATAAQPAIELPPSVKLTVPVGLKPLTVAVMITGAAKAAGLGELKREVVLAALLTPCDSVVLVEPVLFASPA